MGVRGWGRGRRERKRRERRGGDKWTKGWGKGERERTAAIAGLWRNWKLERRESKPKGWRSEPRGATGTE